MSPGPRSEPLPRVWLIRIPAFLALGIALFLIYQKATGQISSVVGCGGEAGCSQVLGGRWSEWFGLPVTVLAAVLYGGVLLLTTPTALRALPGLVRPALLAAGMMALLAACWFIALLVFVEKAFCPYCLATHLCGLVFGVAVLTSRATPPGSPATRHKGKATGADHPRPGLALPAALALAGAATLALGQLFGPRPDTHEIVQVAAPANPAGRADPTSQSTPRKTHPAPATKQASFVGGQIVFEVAESPRIGNPEAPRLIAEFFDYTCVSCRAMHGDLKLLRQTYPDQFLVLLAPCPLNVACNPYFTGDSREHPDACEYIRLALAVWRSAPAKFPDFHEFLMTGKTAPPLAEARARAAQLVGSPTLAAALKDPWIDRRLRQTYAHYRLLATRNPRMPKLLLGGSAMLNGTAKDSRTFVAIMVNHFKL